MTIEHKISQKALELVKGQIGDKDKAAEYRSFCEGFPALLRSAATKDGGDDQPFAHPDVAALDGVEISANEPQGMIATLGEPGQA